MDFLREITPKNPNKAELVLFNSIYEVKRFISSKSVEVELTLVGEYLRVCLNNKLSWKSTPINFSWILGITIDLPSWF